MMKSLAELILSSISVHTPNSLRAKTYKKIYGTMGAGYYLSNTTKTDRLTRLSDPIQRKVYEGITRT